MEAMPERKKRRRKPAPIVYATSTVPEKEPDPNGPDMLGYCRVSMSDQNNQRQIDELVKFGVPLVNIFQDKASGKSFENRPGWADLKDNLRRGDMLVIHSLDRLGRNLIEVALMEKELRDKGVTLKVLAQPVDTSNPMGQLLFNVLMSFAQFEREWSLERTMHGLQRARERGRVGGAKPKYTDAQIEKALAAHGGPYAQNAALKASRDLKCAKATVWRRWKAIEERRREEKSSD